MIGARLLYPPMCRLLRMGGDCGFLLQSKARPDNDHVSYSIEGFKAVTYPSAVFGETNGNGDGNGASELFSMKIWLTYRSQRPGSASDIPFLYSV